MTKRDVVIFLLSVLFFASCNSAPGPLQPDAHQTIQARSSPEPTLRGYEPDVSVPDFVNKMPFQSKAEKAGMIAAWKKTPDHQRFRTVHLRSSTNVVHDDGEIAGASGLALFVVDNTKTELARFGLIVMLLRPGDRYISGRGLLKPQSEPVERKSLHPLSGRRRQRDDVQDSVGSRKR